MKQETDNSLPLRPDLIIGALILFGAGYRLFVMVAMDGFIDSDGTNFVALGRNLWAGLGYVDTNMASNITSMWRAPGYPFALGAVQQIVGDAEFSGRVVSLICGTALIA